MIELCLGILRTIPQSRGLSCRVIEFAISDQVTVDLDYKRCAIAEKLS